MTIFGIGALADHPDTEVIVVVSKAPAPAVADAVIAGLAKTGKPGVVHFVTAEPRPKEGRIEFAETLEEAAVLACRAANIEIQTAMTDPAAVPARAGSASDNLAPGQVVGLFCGGTLCQEAWSLMHRAGVNVRSNVAADRAKKIHPEEQAAGHVLWDLGDDAFTIGKPHPMIEPSLRDERVAIAGSDPEIGVVLVDCVIGYGAHVDPARSLAEAVRSAMEAAKADGRTLAVLASVTGTALDPQNASEQRKTLEDAGVTVAESNAAAVRMAIELIEEASQ